MTEQNSETTAATSDGKRAFAPNGKEIVGTLDILTALCHAAGFSRSANGDIEMELAGGSKLFYEEQRPIKRNGHDVYLDEDGIDWTADEIHLEGEEPRATTPAAPAHGLQVVVATFTHKHGTDTRVFADAADAETWRQELAAEHWGDFMNEDAPADPAAKADRYFQRGNELGNEFFETTETEVKGPTAPSAPQHGMTFDDQETAIIIAALRMIQRMGVQTEEDDIASGGGAFDPFGDDDIDGLIERINLVDKADASSPVPNQD